MISKSFFLFLLITLPFSFCEIKISELTFEDKAITLSDLTDSEYYFKLSFLDNSIIPNYLKIMVTQIELAQYINNYIISYYGNDINFRERTQTALSKSSIEAKVFLWLNKAQIKDGFFFKVELQDKNINIFKFKIDITKSDYIELDTKNFGYKYYVTEQTKNMDFLIKGEKDFFQNDDTSIILWADGNKKITANINATNYVKHSNHNAFIIYNTTKYQEYILSVNGCNGDFIDVGVVFVQQKNQLYDYFAYSSEDILKIFLKKNILEKICFEDYKYIKPIDDINIKLPLDHKNNMQCVSLPDGMDELFFVNHILWYFGYPLVQNSPIYFSLLPGNDYYQDIPGKVTIGYIPLNIDENINFLTYTINSPLHLNAEVYISNCNNYPSCKIDAKELNDSIRLYKTFDKYIYTFKREEIVDYISAVGYKRKIIFLKCNEKKSCRFNININTDKSYKSKMEQKTNKEFYFIDENNVNNFILFPLNYAYLFKLEFLVPTYEFHLEQLSGDISFATNNTYTNYNNNYYVFPLKSDDEIINLKIEAKKNSFYNIKICYIFTEYNERNYYNKYIVPQSGNYMFDFNFEQGKKVTVDFYQASSFSYLNNFFYPINCSVEIEYENQWKTYYIKKYNSPDGTKFYHDNSIYGYYNIYASNNEKSCKIYISTYSCDIANLTDNEIILKENSPQVFFLSNKNLNIQYGYYFKDLDSDINIKITLLNEGEFCLYLFFDDILGRIINITSSQVVTIDKNNLKSMYKFGQIYKLSYIIVKTNDKNNDYFFEITINPLNKGLKEYKTISNMNNSKIIIYIILFVLLILVLLIFVIYYKKVNIYSKLSKKNKTIEMEEIEGDFKDTSLILDNKK